MSDSVAPDVATTMAPVATAGSLLREAREASGLHIAALAVAMKVPVRKLEALESDRLGELPDAVFARALASSMCRALKIDPAPVLALLPSSSAPLISQMERGINAPFRIPGDAPPPGLLTQLSKPTMLMVLVILAGAAIILLLPASLIPSSQPGTRLETVAPAPPAAQVPSEPSTLLPPSDMPAGTPASSVAPVVPAPGANSAASTVPSGSPANMPANAPANTPANTPAIVSGTPAASGAPSATPAAATGTVVSGVPAGTGIVSFSATGSSWVEVTDAKGVVALRRTLQAGESAGASGAPPLAVVVGRVDMTRVQVRGKDFNLAPVARDNVARFEVK